MVPLSWVPKGYKVEQGGKDGLVPVPLLGSYHGPGCRCAGLELTLLGYLRQVPVLPRHQDEPSTDLTLRANRLSLETGCCCSSAQGYRSTEGSSPSQQPLVAVEAGYYFVAYSFYCFSFLNICLAGEGFPLHSICFYRSIEFLALSISLSLQLHLQNKY